jgi:hypothetical protein
MKTHILLILTLVAFSSLARAGEDLALKWVDMISLAQKDAKVFIRDSHTGVFGGVYTRTQNPTFGHGKEGDAALALYNSCTKKFYAWAKQEGAERSISNVSGGEISLRIKAANGDYLSALYRPPTKTGAMGTVTFVFVDADEFAQPTVSATSK